MSARLFFTNDDDEATTYWLDELAGSILDRRRDHPEATVTHTMPARDRAQAVALMRLALSVLEEEGTA